MLPLLVPFLFALLVAAGLVPVCRTVARRMGWTVQTQAGQPLAHQKTQLGGVALGLAFLSVAAAGGNVGALPVVAACTAIVFLVGVACDFGLLRPYTKLVALIAIASAFLYFDLRLHWSTSQTLDSIITLFWIVGITAAFDLLDNMDGLCAGTALIGGAAFLLTVIPIHPEGPGYAGSQYLAALLGATAGFLLYNIHPATIAMGQAGSLVLGLNMAAMTLDIAPGRGSILVAVIAVPSLLLLIPIFDAVLVALSRPQTPVAGSHAGASRLLAMGMSHRAAVRLLWVLSAAGGTIALLADSDQQELSGLIAAMFVIAMALFAVQLTRITVHENTDPARISGTVMPLGMEHGYRRRIVEVLLDALLVTVAYYGAHRLRYDANEWTYTFQAFFSSLPMVVGVQVVALHAVGAYRGLWRYFSLSDSVTFAEAVFVGGLASHIALISLNQAPNQALSILAVYGMLLLLLLVGSRASFRLVSEFARRHRNSGVRAVIYGADDHGAIALRHFVTDPQSALRVVGFIDDDVRKRHVTVQGQRVIGGYDHLAGMIMAREIDAVVLTDDRADIQALASLCARHGVTLQRFMVDVRVITPDERQELRAVAGGDLADSRVVPFVPARRRGDGILAPTGEAVQATASAHPIRVVHVITRLILGGAQENTLYTAIGQHQDPRFDVTLLCGIDEAGEGNMFGQATRAGLKTVVMPALLREIRPVTDLRAWVDLYRFFKRGKFDIVHTHSSKAGILGRIAARAAGVPVIVHTIHGMAFHEYQAAWKNRLYIVLERLCAPVSDRIISVSQRLSEAAMTHHIGRPDQHMRVFSGIELDLFLSVRDSLSVEDAKRAVGIPADAPVVGKIARLFELKGHEQFMDVASRIALESPRTHFLLVGDGPLHHELRAEAERRGFSDRLIMVGRVPPEAVPSCIQAMDVVVHTSLREGIARVLPQAGAVGKPVVTFRLDGAPEVVQDGVSGHLVPALDTAAVAERTLELLRDPERRRAFGEAGRRFASEHFSVERMVDRISALYIELLGRRPESVVPPAR